MPTMKHPQMQNTTGSARSGGFLEEALMGHKPRGTVGMGGRSG